MAEPLAPDALWRLAAWTSAAYPVGAFAHSHGLETAIAQGAVTDAATARAWIADALAHGAGRTDAILAAHAWRAGREGAAPDALAELARALAPARERLVETEALGAAFARATSGGWDAEAPDAPQPVALGWAAGRAGLPLAPVLLLALQGFAAMLVSAAVRLVPLGQTEGQRILAALGPLAAEIAEAAAEAPLDAVGGACFAGDIAAMAHETQDPRLFRT